MKRALLLATVILGLVVVPAANASPPTYRGGCFQWLGIAGGLEWNVSAAGAQWVDVRIHDGGYYGPWMGDWYYNYSNNSYYGETDYHMVNRWVEAQYAIGNSSGWRYGSMGWFYAGYSSDPPCG